MKGLASKRQMLRSALVASADSLAQAQASLDADEEVRSYGEVELGNAGVGGVGGDIVSDALGACAVAEQLVATARARLDRPLNAAWLEGSPSENTSDDVCKTCADEEKLAVEVAQNATGDSEVAVACLMERLRQLRRIRAKLRVLLAASEARFRSASALLTDAGSLSKSSGVEEAVQLASTALTHARGRLRGPLGRDYLAPSNGSDRHGSCGGGGGLAEDEEAVSEATGYVTALESFATSAVEKLKSAKKQSVLPHDDAQSSVGNDGGLSSFLSPETTNASASSNLDPDSILQHTVREALTLAVQWSDALRAQVGELRLTGDPAVATALEASGNAMRAARELWNSDSSSSRRRSVQEGDSGGAEGRAAVETLAAKLGRLEKVAEDAAEERRLREAGLGAAARRLDRLIATHAALKETVEAAGEPLVFLTVKAMRRAGDATKDAAAAASTAGIVAGPEPPASRRHSSLAPLGSSGAASFVDAVQTAAVAVAQAEATVTRARERASQVSAERVRTLETLVGLAEALSAAGDRLSSSSAERGIQSSREAAVVISEAQAALGRARAAAQGNPMMWLSEAGSIAEAVAMAGDLVRRAERAADGPVVVHPTTGPNGPGRNVTAMEVAEAEAKARAWLEAGAKGGGTADKLTTSPLSGEGAVRDINTTTGEKEKAKGGRMSRIGFSEKGEGAPTYLPLWMRLQKKAWDAMGGSGSR